MNCVERRNRIKELRKELFDLEEECTTHAVKKGKYGGGYCVDCKQNLGWYCPDSPDHICYYETDEGEVELINGEKVKPPEGHDFDYETYDHCIFCGDPDERK